MPQRLTLLDLPEFSPDYNPREIVHAINDRLRRLTEVLNEIDVGSTTTIIRDRTTTTAASGNQVVIYKLLTANETIALPGPEVPVGSVVLYILRQPVGSFYAIAWAAGFKGSPGNVPLRSNSYSTFRFYKVSETELLLLDYPLRGEAAV